MSSRNSVEEGESDSAFTAVHKSTGVSSSSSSSSPMIALIAGASLLMLVIVGVFHLIAGSSATQTESLHVAQRPLMKVGLSTGNGHTVEVVDPIIEEGPTFRAMHPGSDAVQTIAEFRGLGIGQVHVPQVTNRQVFYSALKDKSPRIIYVHNTLSVEAADAFVQYAEAKIERSHVIALNNKEGNELRTEIRSSYGLFLTEPDGLDGWFNRELKAVAEAVTGIPPENYEATQILRYHEGQRYVAHSDYFDDADKANLDRGGQRIATLLTWLNVCEHGGGTEFPSSRVELTPRRGDSCLFYDADATGKMDPGSIHAGNPPKNGSTKWVAVIWMHPRQFT